MMTKYVVIKDTREQNGWDFPENEYCGGMVNRKLDTGDYSVLGLEDKLCIERKRSTGELAGNICEKRFFRELERMENFPHSFLILEFDYNDLILFPARSGIPPNKWKRLKITSRFLLKKMVEIDLQYKVKIIFAPHNGIERSSLIFRYISEMYDGC